ncbi:MAG: photosynthetic reaction center cytochrome c subunit family protein [Gemmatimonadaceae bacterium]
MRSYLVSTAVVALTLGVANGAPAQPDSHGESREYNTALGVSCEHCHVDTDRRASTKPTFDFARRMAAMVRGLNAGPLSGRRPITCWSCHRGQSVPARLPRTAWESIASEYASVFARGHADQELSMSVYAASLGVDCAHCHVQGAWADRSRPAHATARAMVSMFELIPTFYDAAVRRPRTQCFMCHHGSTVIARTPPAP